MPSLTCSALHWRRSIRSLRALQTEGSSGEMKQQDKEAEKGVGEEYLTRSFLPGAPLSYTFKHPAFPTASLDTEHWTFISYSAPMHEWHHRDYLVFHKGGEGVCRNYYLLQKQTATIRWSCVLFLLRNICYSTGDRAWISGLQTLSSHEKGHWVSGLQFYVK